MITKPVVQDFPKNKLKTLFNEADEILILHAPDLSLSLMTESFSAALRQYLNLISENQKKAQLTLCTNFIDIFNLNKAFDSLISYHDYLSFLRIKQKDKKNTLVIDFSNDSNQNFFFEFDRMTKWPVFQKPYFSKLVFHWQNLPQNQKEDNILSCRYLSLFEQIVDQEFFIKPRFPKIYLDEENLENLRHKLILKYNLNQPKYYSIALFYSINPVNSLSDDSFWKLVDALIKKKANLEINIILNPDLKDQKIIKKVKEEISRRRIFSLLRPREIHLIEESLFEILAILQTQKLFITPENQFLHLANTLGVKTISLHGPSSRHFISNYRLGNPFYPDSHFCEFLSKTNSLKGKGYLSPCLKSGQCLNKNHCLSSIDLEKIVKKACQIL